MVGRVDEEQLKQQFKQPWFEEALELSKKGVSWRQIARDLSVPRTTVSDALRKYYRERDALQARKKVVRHGDFSIGRKHLIIADTQVKPNADLTHLKALGKYIAEIKPDVIVHIGDHFDMESLSFYDRGKRSFEGRRVRADIDAGHLGMRVLVDQWKDVDNYSPEMVFCLGNHEERIDRFANDNPEFTGYIGTELLNLEQYGWEVYPFLKPVVKDGVHYVHYLANPFSGKPFGGSALNQLKNVGNSFVIGHKQCLDIAIRPTLDGKMQLGIINGAYYPHFEEYKGYTGNNHFRGVTVLHEVKDGFGLPMMVSLEYLLNKYA